MQGPLIPSLQTMRKDWIPRGPGRALALRLQDLGEDIKSVGGVDGSGQAAPSLPLTSECFPFAQKGCMEFVGSKEQVVSVKQSPSLQALRHAVHAIRVLPPD